VRLPRQRAHPPDLLAVFFAPPVRSIRRNHSTFAGPAQGDARDAGALAASGDIEVCIGAGIPRLGTVESSIAGGGSSSRC
jgi:hypothetical protein